MPIKTVVNCSTGIQTNVEMTSDEIAALEAMTLQNEKDQAEQEAAAAKKSADRESGNQKLKDLGLTDDEIAAITS